jgi:transcriptional regulator with XRE-family HTH domain
VRQFLECKGNPWNQYRKIEGKLQMALKISREMSQRIRKARLERHRSIEQLADDARVSERSITNIEHFRRETYNDETILRLCRALEVNYTDLVNHNNNNDLSKKWVSAHRWMLVIVGLAFTSIVTVIYLFHHSSSSIHDWIDPEQRLAIHEPIPDWKGQTGIHVNYFYPDNWAIQPDDTINLNLRWCYHNEGKGSTPVYYVTSFTEWEPDSAIQLMKKTIFGDGGDTFKFKVISPKTPGEYRIRAFFSPSFGPVSGFFGHAPPNQIKSPMGSPYAEINIEVRPARQSIFTSAVKAFLNFFS